MPDKLTDSEIKKALECCMHGKCEDSCPFSVDREKCHKLDDFVLDLINRLQADKQSLIEHLKKARRQLKTAKAEAYKEFADKTYTEIHQALESNYKARAERIEKHNVGETDEFISYCQGKIDALRGIGDFCDNLLKELVGEE